MTTVEVLSRLLPSLDEINQLLARVRKEHDIPHFLPEQTELAEAVRSDRCYDWDAIQQELESGVRELFQQGFAETGLDKWFTMFTGVMGNGPQIKAILVSPFLGVSEPVAGLIDPLARGHLQFAAELLAAVKR